MGIMLSSTSSQRGIAEKKCVKPGGRPMSKVTTLQLLDPLKVFVEYDTQYDTYVAQCLQTGHLVTANDSDLAKEMITELLQDEVSLAVEKNDISSLLSNPAPLELRIKWELAA